MRSRPCGGWRFSFCLYVRSFLLVGGREFPVVHILPLPRWLLVGFQNAPRVRLRSRGILFKFRGPIVSNV